MMRSIFHGTRRRTLLVLTAAATFAATSSLLAQEKLQVVTTTGMIADAARVIGGEHVEVKSLMGAGVDPHSYRQTRSDIVAMTRADIVLWHGLYLEAQMEEFFEDLEKRKPVLAVADGIPTSELLANTDYQDRFDPHVWMDPRKWAKVVDAVAQAFSDEKPDSAEEFTTNARVYKKELIALHDYSTSALQAVEIDRRILLTAHDAFGYFGEAYDFDVVGIQGISTESEAGLNRISTLVNLLVERDIRAIFVETSVSDRNIRALIEGAGAKGHEVVIGGSLFSDAMGPEGTYEGTYLGMIDHNVTTIAAALGIDVPANGRLGKLEVGG